MSRVGIDLDGVCYDFAASLREYLTCERFWSASSCPEPTRWEFYEDWGLTLRQFTKFCNRGVDAGFVFAYGAPFEGTRDALMKLRDAGHTLHIITDRTFGSPGASEAATKAWLARHDLPYDTLTFTADKTSVPTDYMIDDKLSNYDALEAAGCEVYLLDRPWNQDNSTHRRRTVSLGEFAELVCALADEKLRQTSDATEVRTTSATGGQKGTKQARYDLIPAGPLRTIAELYGRGAEKYEDRNWEKGYDWSLSFAALNRHLWAFWGGEDTDTETGKPHMASVAWHAMALLEFMEKHPGYDNRPKP